MSQTSVIYFINTPSEIDYVLGRLKIDVDLASQHHTPLGLGYARHGRRQGQKSQFRYLGEIITESSSVKHLIVPVLVVYKPVSSFRSQFGRRVEKICDSHYFGLVGTSQPRGVQRVRIP